MVVLRCSHLTPLNDSYDVSNGDWGTFLWYVQLEPDNINSTEGGGDTP